MVGYDRHVVSMDLIVSRTARLTAVALAVISCLSTQAWAGGEKTATSPDYLRIVTRYADTMIVHARDRYGKEHSPLFAAGLSRDTLSLLEGKELKRVRNLPRSGWGIRPDDRTITGANPMHHENFYQVLYALSKMRHNPTYKREADKALEWFFENCQHDATGLLYWGEEAGWDFLEETGRRDIHEFFRPWVLWDRTFQVSPGACAEFARGLWNHQIADQETGDFSRHAYISRHGPGRHSQYPRHAGFYIRTWAHAYKHTDNSVYLKAIRTLLDFYTRHRSEKAGAIPAEVGNPRSKGKLMWPQSNLSLALDLHESAPGVPEKLKVRMRAMAAKIDEAYLRLPHHLGPQENGFVTAANPHTLKAADVRGEDRRVRSRLWATGYGQSTDAKIASMCLARYRQTGKDGYGKLAMSAARRYLDTEPRIGFPVYPGTLGHAIWLMIGVHEVTGDEKYLDRADHFGRQACDMFFPAGSGLPRASSKHDHYEAITRGDTLALALLKLWQVQHRPDAKLAVKFTDR